MQRLLAGRSARIVVTMGMPALVYRWYFGAHGVRNLKRSILGFCGLAPIRVDLIGSVEGPAVRRAAWLERMRTAGRAGD
jgi:putative NADPH-quinone reductase